MSEGYDQRVIDIAKAASLAVAKNCRAYNVPPQMIMADIVFAINDAIDAGTLHLSAAPEATPERAGREVSLEEVEAVARAISQRMDSQGDPEPIEQQRVDREWPFYEEHARIALDAILGLRSMGVGSDGAA